MKQKRKVKSLLPQRNDGRGIFLTILLLVLGLVLCLGSASLMTTMVVGASSAGTDSTLSYTGVDDKVEVLYDLKFAKPTNLRERVGWLFTKLNNDFYIKTKKAFPLVVNTEDFSSSNEVASGLYSNILGGSNNKILSGNNITIIGGEGLKVEGKNDNSVILGGKNNSLEGGSGAPSVMVGGEGNRIKSNHDGVVIIGGNNQTVGENAENVILIGGSNITVGNNVKNVIAGGKNVDISDGMENIFVFSNSSQFKPATSNTFYLNVEKGVGVNVEAPGNYGLEINGSVKVGGIDISNRCNNSNYGVIGAWNIGGDLACLVGCDARSASSNKWDLLDRSDVCVEACDANVNCDVFDLPMSGFTGQYVAICTSGVDTKYASPCNPNEWTQYKNVFFETALIDAKDTGKQCPGVEGTNKCVYQCNSGYHLTGDITNSSSLGSRKGIIGCFRDCNLEKIINDQWTVGSGTDRIPIILKHNETILAYNMEEVACSYHRYEPPTDGPTSFKNYLDDGFGTKRSGGSFGIDRSNRYELPEHCGNNGHKQKLICVDGKVFIANNDGKTSTDKAIIGSNGVGNWNGYPGYANSGYIYKDCRTAPYQCDTTQGRYDLTREYIRTTLLETGHLDHSYFGGGVKDRNKVMGVRGIYQICYDYLTGANYKKYLGTGLGNELCIIDTGAMGRYSDYGDNNDYLNYYHFVKCNEGSGYYPSIREDDIAATNNNTKGTICRKSCKVRTADKGEQITLDRDSIRLYKSSVAECEYGTCDYKDFMCVDGKWESQAEMANYQYLQCQQKGHACDSSFNVDAATNDYKPEYSVYEGPCYKRQSRPNQTDWLYKPTPIPNKGKLWDKGFDVTGCSVNELYKLVECANCHHTNNGKYCEDDENLGLKYECQDRSSQGWAVMGYKYTQWTSESYKGGTMGPGGGCYYYCDRANGYYDNGYGGCSRSQPVPATCADVATDISDFTGSILGYSGGNIVRSNNVYSGENESEIWSVYTGIYYTGTYYTGEDGEEEIQREQIEKTYVCFNECDDGYERSNNTCNLKGSYGCTGVVPLHSYVVNSGYQGDSYREYGYVPAGLEVSWDGCYFTCETGYTWSGYACIYKGWKCNVCSNTVTYNPNGGSVDGGRSSDEIPCTGSISLPGATRDCYKFEGWYIGSDTTTLYQSGYNFSSNVPVSLTAKWTRDTSTAGCEYRCGGTDGPVFNSAIMEWNISDLDRDGIQWQYVSDYSAPLNKCQWRCLPGYDRNGNTCKERECGTDASHPEPGNLHTIVGSGTYVGNDQDDKYRKWTFKSGATSVGACEWTCRNGYVQSGAICVPKKCGGTPGTGAQVKMGNSEYVGDDKNRKSVTGTTNPGECEWTCINSGTDLYIPNEAMHRCDLVVDGKCTNGTGKKLNSKTCFKGNPGPTRTEGNKDVWDCLSPNGGQTDVGCFMCKSGWTGENCELEIKAGRCVNTTIYGCNPGSAINTGQNDSAHKYTWDCDGENGGARQTGCYKCYPDYTPDNAGQCNYNPAPVNGQCDTLHFGCITGDPDEQFTGNLQWTWKCKNRHGGTDMPCSEPFPTYKVHFEPNKLEGSMSDQIMHMHTSEQLKPNEFSKVGYAFDHWNTEADDSGASYSNRQSVINLTSVSGDTVTLYAIAKCANGYIGIDGDCKEIINGECGTGFNSCAAGIVSGVTQTGADNQYWNSGIRGWQWICEGENTGTPKACTAIWTCNGASDPTCGGDSLCDPNQKPVNGCEMDRACLLPAPGNNTTGGKATYTGDSSNKKYWSSGFKLDTANLGECEWGCIDGYERDGETMNCKKKICEGPCGTAEAGQELTCYPSSSVSCANTGSHCIGETRKCGNDGKWYSGSVQADFPVGNTNTGCSLVGSGCFNPADDGKSCVAKTYTVNYNCGSGTGNPAPQTVVAGITSNVIGNVCTRANFKQKGWSADPNATDPTWGSGVVMNGILVSGCEDITLYAVYDEDSKFTVTFDSLGGSAVTGQSVYSGEKATKPSPDPVREHNPGTGCYIFTGWHTENPPMNLYNWDTKVTKDITLYAKWAGKKYNIVYDCGTGGTLTRSSMLQEVIYGETSKLRTDGCIKTGYVLTGWAGNSNGVLKNWNLGDDMSDFLVEQCGELTVHAVWEGLPACLGSFENAHLVPGSDENLTEDTDSALYPGDEQAAGSNKCAYVCDEGFDYICVQGVCSCAVCEEGTYDPNEYDCIIDVNHTTCGGRVQRLLLPKADGTTGCLAIGNCFSGSAGNSQLYTGTMEGGLSVSYKNSWPIGLGDTYWKCVTGEINEHMCQYHCMDGYRCVNGQCVSNCPIVYDAYEYYKPYWLGGDFDATHYTRPKEAWGVGAGDNWFWTHVDGDERYPEPEADGCYYICGDGEDGYGVFGKDGDYEGCLANRCNEDSLPEGVDPDTVTTGGVASSPNQAYEYNPNGYTYSSSCWYKCDWIHGYEPVTGTDGIIRCEKEKVYKCGNLPVGVDTGAVTTGGKATGDNQAYVYNPSGNSISPCWYKCDWIRDYEPVTGTDGIIRCEKATTYKCGNLPVGVDTGTVTTGGKATGDNQAYVYNPSGNSISPCWYKCDWIRGYEPVTGTDGIIRCERKNKCNESTLPDGVTGSNAFIYDNPTEYNQVYNHDPYADENTPGCNYKCREDEGYLTMIVDYEGTVKCLKNYCDKDSLPYGESVYSSEIENATEPNQKYVFTRDSYDVWYSPGCYYTCSNGLTPVTGEDNVIRCSRYSCYYYSLPYGINQGQYNGSASVYRNPTTGNQEYSYNPDADPDTPGCNYKCNEGYIRISKGNDNYECVQGNGTLCIDVECKDNDGRPCTWMTEIQGCSPSQLDLNPTDCSVYGDQFTLREVKNESGDLVTECVYCIPGTVWKTDKYKCE